MDSLLWCSNSANDLQNQMLSSFHNSSKQSITIFTDGSCHSQLKTGGWASIILLEGQKVILEGTASNTTHQRMELIAVIEALKHIEHQKLIEGDISIYSDSQYVVGLLRRREALLSSNYRTKKHKVVRNQDLVRELLDYMNLPNMRFIKIKAHQKLADIESQLNREVDILSRKNMRNVVINRNGEKL